MEYIVMDLDEFSRENRRRKRARKAWSAFGVACWGCALAWYVLHKALG